LFCVYFIYLSFIILNIKNEYVSLLISIQSQAKHIEAGLRACLLRMKKQSEAEANDEPLPSQTNRLKNIRNQVNECKIKAARTPSQMRSFSEIEAEYLSHTEIKMDKSRDVTALPTHEQIQNEENLTVYEGATKMNETTENVETEHEKRARVLHDQWIVRKKMLYRHRQSMILKYKTRVLVELVSQVILEHIDKEKEFEKEVDSSPVQVHTPHQVTVEMPTLPTSPQMTVNALTLHTPPQILADKLLLHESPHMTVDALTLPNTLQMHDMPTPSTPTPQDKQITPSSSLSSSSSSCLSSITTTMHKTPVRRGLGWGPCPSPLITKSTPQRVHAVHMLSHYPQPKASFTPGRAIQRTKAPLSNEIIDVCGLFNGEDTIGQEIDKYLVLNIDLGGQTLHNQEKRIEIKETFDKFDKTTETSSFLLLLRQAQQFVTDVSQLKAMKGRYDAIVETTPSRGKGKRTQSQTDKCVFVTPGKRYNKQLIFSFIFRIILS
jgi:hypothetical protein